MHFARIWAGNREAAEEIANAVEARCKERFVLVGGCGGAIWGVCIFFKLNIGIQDFLEV